MIDIAIEKDRNACTELDCRQIATKEKKQGKIH